MSKAVGKRTIRTGVAPRRFVDGKGPDGSMKDEPEIIDQVLFRDKLWRVLRVTPTVVILEAVGGDADNLEVDRAEFNQRRKVINNADPKIRDKRNVEKVDSIMGFVGRAFKPKS